VIELDDRLVSLRSHARGWGSQLRGIAAEVASDSDAIARFVDLPVLRYLATASFSADGADVPLVLAGHRFHVDTVLEQVVLFEELAYGDVGALMAAPGAPMAGPVVQMLGDDEQRAWFFDRLHRTVTWTFFGLTEPAHGSDANAIQTRLVPNGDRFALCGTKKYVGNAPRAQLGLVFARLQPGPLGVRAVLVDTAAPGFRATALPTMGLRGALLGTIALDQVAITPDRVLGGHLPATRRGAWSWVRTFNRLRPRVAAMALGLARAAYDYVCAQRSTLRTDERARLAELAQRIRGVQQLVRRAAIAVDAHPADGHLASAAKARAARLAEDVTLAGVDLLGPGACLDHPVFDRFLRDARGLEFMEGAGNIQKLNVAQQLIRGRSHSG
jgi:acyl-CoA dehydrogenase